MPFRHNVRIGSILLPTLVVLVGFGGKLSVAIIMIGAMVRFAVTAHLAKSVNASCRDMQEVVPSAIPADKVHSCPPGGIYHGCAEVQRGCSWGNMDHPGPGKPKHAGI